MTFPRFRFLLLLPLVLLTACADPPATTSGAAVFQADQKCMMHVWPSEVARTNCLDTVEYSVVQADLPYLEPSFRTFAENRRKLATVFDQENMIARENWEKFRERLKDLSAALATMEPHLTDPNGRLMRDIQALDMWHTCTSLKAVPRIVCSGQMMREVWQKDAPDTLRLFDTFQSKRLRIAEEYDTSGAADINRQAVQRHNAATAQMVAGYADYCRKEMIRQGREQNDGPLLESLLSSLAHSSLVNYNGELAKEP